MIREHPDIHLDLYKARIREFYREAERKRLISEARKAQSRPIRTTLTQAGDFFKRFAWRLRTRLWSRRAPQEKHREAHDQALPGSTHSGR